MFHPCQLPAKHGILTLPSDGFHPACTENGLRHQTLSDDEKYTMSNRTSVKVAHCPRGTPPDLDIPQISTTPSSKEMAHLSSFEQGINYK